MTTLMAKDARTGEDFDWAEFAACRGADTNRFVPESYDDAESVLLIDETTEVCWTVCPVQGDCLHYGHVLDLATPKRDRRHNGIYGGFTPTERAQQRIRGEWPW